MNDIGNKNGPVRGQAEQSFFISSFPLIHHFLRNFILIANGVIPTRLAPGAAFATHTSIAGMVIGAWAITRIISDRLANYRLFDLLIAKRCGCCFILSR
jgi:hypothetical protein